MLGKLLRRAETAPATAPVSAPSPMLDLVSEAISVPVDTETVHTMRTTKRIRKPAKKLWAVTDRRGVVVGASTKPVLQETAQTHAAAFLEWLAEQQGFTSGPVLYDLVGRLYLETFCPALGLKPFPWRAVAKALDALPGVLRYAQHIDTDDEHRRVKKHVYRLPDARAAVVDFDMARKRA
jgi:hypothetical protein